MGWISFKLLLSPCIVLLGLLCNILTGGTFPLSCYSQEQMAVVFWGLFVHQVIPIPCILSKSSQLASFKCIIITWPWCTIVLFSLNLPFPKLVKKHKWCFQIYLTSDLQNLHKQLVVMMWKDLLLHLPRGKRRCTVEKYTLVWDNFSFQNHQPPLLSIICFNIGQTNRRSMRKWNA